MNFNLSVITTNALVIVPVVIAIVQAIKLTGWVQDHYSPLLAIGIGIAISWLGSDNSLRLGSVILTGAIYGLMSSGLYSGVKTTMVARARQQREVEAKKEKREFDRNHKNKI